MGFSAPKHTRRHHAALAADGPARRQPRRRIALVGLAVSPAALPGRAARGDDATRERRWDAAARRGKMIDSPPP